MNEIKTLDIMALQKAMALFSAVLHCFTVTGGKTEKEFTIIAWNMVKDRVHGSREFKWKVRNHLIKMYREKGKNPVPQVIVVAIKPEVESLPLFQTQMKTVPEQPSSETFYHQVFFPGIMPPPTTQKPDGSAYWARRYVDALHHHKRTRV
jgi:hypothetical protein